MPGAGHLRPLTARVVTSQHQIHLPELELVSWRTRTVQVLARVMALLLLLRLRRRPATMFL